MSASKTPNRKEPTMGNSTLELVTTSARIYYSRDYARFANALRIARKHKMPEQQEQVAELESTLTAMFADDALLNPDAAGFDAEKFHAKATGTYTKTYEKNSLTSPADETDTYAFESDDDEK
jgi:hypothetical protein